MNPSTCIYVALTLLTILPQGCTGSKMPVGGANPEQLAACPDRPNCVSSQSRDEGHAVAPFRLKGDAAAWRALQDMLGKQPRTTLVKATDRYSHLECKSRLFGFIDDLELLLDPASGRIDLRSASRVGYFDLGVNRRRIETLRRSLQENGLIH